MRAYMRLSLAILLLGGCSSSTLPPGNIAIDLEVDPAVSQATKDSIEQIVFLVGESSETKTLYPAECIGCADGKTTCAASDQCLKFIGCGYDPEDETFSPEIPFDQVGNGKTLEIISCGLDINQSPVVAGEGSVQNTDGETASITLDETLEPCTENLPPLCT